jgi:hypothetical protein
VNGRALAVVPAGGAVWALTRENASARGSAACAVPVVEGACERSGTGASRDAIVSVCVRS